MFLLIFIYYCFFFFSSRRRHTSCALVTGVQTCALPISRRLALDVEIFLLLEAEQLGVEARPGSHLAAPDVVREMIEQFEPDIVLGLRLAPAGDFLPIGIKIGTRLHQIEVRAADALDRARIVAEDEIGRAHV